MKGNYTTTVSGGECVFAVVSSWKMRTLGWILSVVGPLLLCTVLCRPASAQTPSNLDFTKCAVSALGQRTPLRSDGSYTLRNVPNNTGTLVRVELICRESPTVAFKARSSFFTLTGLSSLAVPALQPETIDPPPQKLRLELDRSQLVGPGDRVSGKVVGEFLAGAERNLSFPSTGTSYRSSNPAIATVSEIGLVQSVSSGSAVIFAFNQGRTASLRITSLEPGQLDTDQDGMADGCEEAFGLNPLDPTDAGLDPDLDNLTNLGECTAGTDPGDPDTDLDGVLDGDEGPLGTDPLIADTDLDRLIDGDEVAQGTDPLRPDTDLGCLIDGLEITLGLNPLLASDDLQDVDGDTLDSCSELGFGSDPALADTDGDGLRDDEEVLVGNDGFITDPRSSDTDSDGLLDLFEVVNGFDPTLAGETNGDPDLDGVDNLSEQLAGTDPNDSDTDADGVDDGTELATLGLDPLDPDVDDDGFLDGAEIMAASDPQDAFSVPAGDEDADGIDNQEEVIAGVDGFITDAFDVDTDDDFIDDGEEVALGADGFLTHPGLPDTDADGVSDPNEISLSFDPSTFDNYATTDLILNGTTLELDLQPVFQSLSLQNGAVLTHRTATTSREFRLVFSVGALNIDATSSIDVSERGYLGGFVNSDEALGRTLGNIAFNQSTRGGGYGGRGGTSSTAVPPNEIYGDFRDPDELGSGGGGSQGALAPRELGGSGGGLVRLTAQSIQLDGTIVADGGMATTSFAGSAGGSGGGIRIDTTSITGSGTILARGGNQTTTGGFVLGGAGGGGRIAVYYDDATGFDLDLQIDAQGGLGGTGSTAQRNAGAGTIYLRHGLTQNFGVLIAENHGFLSEGESTALRAVGLGSSAGVLANQLTDSAASFPVPDPAIGSLGLVGLELKPMRDDATRFTVIGNTATELFTDPADGDMTAVAMAGDFYIGVIVLDDLVIRGEARVVTDDEILVLGTTNTTLAVEGLLDAEILELPLTQTFTATEATLLLGGVIAPQLSDATFTNSFLSLESDLLGLTNMTLVNSTLDLAGTLDADSLSLQNGSNLGHPAATTTEEFRLEILTQTLTIDATSSIDVSERGYLGGNVDSDEFLGRTLGNIAFNQNTRGGGYGGRGGTNTPALPPNEVYGDFKNPNELGSGGGGSQGAQAALEFGGSGGGLVRITAQAIQLDGNITSNGGIATTSFAGSAAGSGGGIFVDTTSITGAGTIDARGGNQTSTTGFGAGGGGGGGRIALYYDDATGFDLELQIDARGGVGGDSMDAQRNAGAGTIYLVDRLTSTDGLLRIDNNGIVTQGRSTSIRAAAERELTALSAGLLTDSGASFPLSDPATGALGLIGLELNPNRSQDQTFTIIDNTATEIFTDLTDGDMTSVAAIGDAYISTATLFDLEVTENARLGTDGELVVEGEAGVPLSFSGNSVELGGLRVTAAQTLSLNGSANASIGLLNSSSLDTISVAGSALLKLRVGTLSLASLVVDGATADIDGTIQSTDVQVINGGILSHPDSTLTTEPRLGIVATTCTIDATSSIDLLGSGYLGGLKGGNSFTGRTLGNVALTTFGGGAYGGLGGNVSNPVYGFHGDPGELGTGGAGSSGTGGGGNGGGRVSIQATTLTLDGTIRADGELATGGFFPAAGGSGGSIAIDVATLTGAGSMSAAGGDHTVTGAFSNSAGGGGRIVVRYDDSSGFSLAAIDASGGTSAGTNLIRHGGAGTILFVDRMAGTQTLVIDNDGTTTAPTGFSTLLTGIGPRTSVSVSPQSIQSTSGGFPIPDAAIGARGLVGLRVNPNTAQAQTFRVIDNTADTLFTDPADGDMTAVAIAGDSMIGVIAVADLLVINGSRVDTVDFLDVSGTLTVDAASALSSDNITIP